jgi:hypothetical protein
VLSDDKKRALYDQYGEAVVKSSVGGGSSAYAVFNMIFLVVCLVCKIREPHNWKNDKKLFVRRITGYFTDASMSRVANWNCLLLYLPIFWCFYKQDLYLIIFFLQTNPFDLFERFFGPSMGGFAGMDPTGFGTRRRSSVTKGEDIRWVILWMIVYFSSSYVCQVNDYHI